MQTALTSPKYINWSRDRWLIYLLLTLSTIYWSLDVYEMQAYRPWHLRMGRAVADSAFWHFWLWLSTIQFQKRWRPFIAVILFLNSVGFVLIWGLVHPLAGAIAFAGMGRLMRRVVSDE